MNQQMLDESLRRRLEALNRGPLPSVPTAMRATPRPAPKSPRAIVSPRAVRPLPGLMRRAEVVATESGEHLRICIPLEQLWPRGPQLVAARRQELAKSTGESHAELAAVIEAFPDRVLLVDLETCGLAGAALFLVGLLRTIDDSLTIELLLARNYAEERAVLCSFWQVAAGCEVLLTFNGKSFDWPTILDRSQRHLLHKAGDWRLETGGGSLQPPASSLQLSFLHVDILHHARRRWKNQLPDCRLQTLERHICRRGRTGDIPGHMIPATYADYVRTGFERDIEAILFHNALDLVTLLDLAMRLPG
jgi:uncharacterized protein YprB with RNaseH-like and TPR domain